MKRKGSSNFSTIVLFKAYNTCLYFSQSVSCIPSHYWNLSHFEDDESFECEVFLCPQGFSFFNRLVDIVLFKSLILLSHYCFCNYLIVENIQRPQIFCTTELKLHFFVCTYYVEDTPHFCTVFKILFAQQKTKIFFKISLSIEMELYVSECEKSVLVFWC